MNNRAKLRLILSETGIARRSCFKKIFLVSIYVLLLSYVYKGNDTSTLVSLHHSHHCVAL